MSLRNHWHTFRTAALVLLTAALAACVDQPTVPDSEAAAPTPLGAFDGPSFATAETCVILAQTGSYNNNSFAPLNDFGRILSDADKASCSAQAAKTLTARLDTIRMRNPNWFGDEWIDGNYVAMVLAAADRIGFHGQMTPELDAQLQWVASTFKYVAEPYNGCGLDQTDGCLDGYSAAAAGFAWVAAYRYRHNDPTGAGAARALADSFIDSSFNSVCIRKRATVAGPLCDGTKADLAAGTAYTWSWNEGPQSPAYGFGLMTSIAAAVLGLERAGAPVPYVFSAEEKTVARGLFEEARRLVGTDAGLDEWPACGVASKDTTTGKWSIPQNTVQCSPTSGGPYQPNMYALKAFYAARLGYTPPTDGYQSASFDSTKFDLSASSTAREGWFSYGRLVFYGDLGHYWWKSDRKPMPMDTYEARGYLDRIDGGRVAHGWACDRDTATAPVKVQLRVAGTTVTGLANLPSESAVNTQCGGGSAHRFSIQLPAGTVGYTVTARALDYTYGYTDLACAQAGACVVPAAPTVQVVWVRPAEESWGQPNTHTAAGNANGGTGGVKLEWRDVTFTSNPAWNVVANEPVPDANGGWSNTIPSAYRCHKFQVRATYFGVTTPIFPYDGRASGYCSQTARIIWIQPSSTAGYGPPGGLVVAGEARGAPAGTTVAMYYRNVTLGGGFVRKSFAATPDANGIWLNDIPNVNPYHQYEVYATFDVTRTLSCTYAGTNGMTSC